VWENDPKENQMLLAIMTSEFATASPIINTSQLVDSPTTELNASSELTSVSHVEVGQTSNISDATYNQDSEFTGATLGETASGALGVTKVDFNIDTGFIAVSPEEAKSRSLEGVMSRSPAHTTQPTLLVSEGVAAQPTNPSASTTNNVVSHTEVSGDTPRFERGDEFNYTTQFESHTETETDVFDLNGTDWELAEDLGAGWKQTEWFGHYFESSNTEWIYRPCGGWFYKSGTSFDSIWFWSADLGGWLWTNKDAYPNMYSHATGSWIYVNDTHHCIYDYLKDAWSLIGE
jgi:hypothetical protein